MRNLIFVGGIHGVGKSTFCSEISDNHGIKVHSASKLIALKKKETYTKDKRIQDINSNQIYLLEALDEVESNQVFLLDGHFCLLDINGGITRIPKQTFIDISPRVIVVLIDSVNEIISRLQARDSHVHNHSVIKEFQDEEISYAKIISEELNVPLFIIDSENRDNKIQALLALA
ncbi:ATP-binding protein [Paenibacillus alginolyticus]|uniref:ATP-binding protein n=1 Tax=Paenibacillus alginolyticus TaxID=59839 RepID=A0ABT4GMY9_9BACL|nr:ATP-binding protein [Paenibacillus alginolyticus]MCY9697582.1 ATP-binding protein [Paenibacillus alginolyticus]MEC0143350.1 ATP-binding protein [Paenibacillus alginolyticus]